MINLDITPVWVEFYGDIPEIDTLKSFLTLTIEEDGVDKKVELFEDNKFLTGLLNFVKRELDKRQIQYTCPTVFYEKRNASKDILEGVTLRDYQLEAVRIMLSTERGIAKMATGSGKSEVYAAVIKTLNRPSLCVVGKVSHAYQLKRRAEDRGVSDVGIVGGEFRDLDCKHVIAVPNSLYSGIKKSDPEILALLEKTEVFFCDETHHAKSVSWMAIASRCPNATRRYGLSATPFDAEDPFSNPDDLMLMGITGEVIVDVSSKELRDLGYLAEPTVYMLPIMSPHVNPRIDNWHIINKLGVVENQVRNETIANLCFHIVARGGKPLVIVAMIEHGKTLVKKMYERGVNAFFAYGGSSCYEICGSGEKLEEHDEKWISDSLLEGKYDVLIGSTIYDEGVDLPVVSDVIVAGAGRATRRLLQRMGRGLRLYPGKTKVNIWDFYDGTHWALKAQSEKRIKIYTKEHCEIIRGLESAMTTFPEWVPQVISEVI